jgi:hypothetical protein
MDGLRVRLVWTRKGRQEDTIGELIWRSMWEVWCKDKEEAREMKREKGIYSHVG